MIVTIDKILQRQNKTVYWLAKETQCDYQSMKRLVMNESIRISFDLLESVCMALDCTPSDILQITKTK